jgi:hypothetical protein
MCSIQQVERIVINMGDYEMFHSRTPRHWSPKQNISSVCNEGQNGCGFWLLQIVRDMCVTINFHLFLRAITLFTYDMASFVVETGPYNVSRIVKAFNRETALRGLLIWTPIILYRHQWLAA